MTKLIFSIALLCCLGGVALAGSAKVADITRLDGQRVNTLNGMGLVTGLAGTGDSGEFLAKARPLAALLAKFDNTTTVAELSKAKNVAVVTLSATVPKDGVRHGDMLDVQVTSFGDATSLRGGRLFISPMQGAIPDGGLYAMSSGPISIEDITTPTVGVVKSGCVMEVDLQMNYVTNGKFALILQDPAASWTTASLIARTINGSESENGETIAYAVDPKEVMVNIPPAERARPEGFISRVQQLTVPVLPTEARVQINERTGTLVVTGDVEISPVVITSKGLTISTVTPPPVPTPNNPLVKNREWAAIDTSNQPNAKLQDLINALEQVKVPIADRIAIIKELWKTGYLHAKVIIE
jgi:flagellar P-ring protein precursor FlgI